MPVPININTNIFLSPTPIVSKMRVQHYGNMNSTGESTYLYSTERYIQVGKKNKFQYDNNSKYIKAVENFKQQFNKNKLYFEDVDFSIAEKKFNRVISTLLELSPEIFSFEVTSEGGVFFSFKKNSHSFYLQYFFDDGNFNNDIILTGFFNDDKLPSYEGSISSILEEMKNHISDKYQVLT